MGAIKHKGIVKQKKDDKAFISIIENINCSSCRAKNVCSVATVKDDLLYFEDKENILLCGDLVNVAITHNKAFKAVFYAYIFPFLILVTIIFILSTKFSEFTTGIIAICGTFLYFFILFFLNQIWKKNSD